MQIHLQNFGRLDAVMIIQLVLLMLIALILCNFEYTPTVASPVPDPACQKYVNSLAGKHPSKGSEHAFDRVLRTNGKKTILTEENIESPNRFVEISE